MFISVVSGNVFASRSKVRRIQTWLRSMDFFQDVKVLCTSPLGGTLSRGSQVWDFELVKEFQARKEKVYEQNIIDEFKS